MKVASIKCADPIQLLAKVVDATNTHIYTRSHTHEYQCNHTNHSMTERVGVLHTFLGKPRICSLKL